MTRVLALAALLLASGGARAQDPLARLGDVQGKLAAGTDAQRRLRIDGLTPAGGVLKVTGVFLDAPPKAGAAPAFDTAQDEAGATLRESLNDKALRFDWSGVTRVGEKDQPHAVLQRAANAAGAKGDAAADQLLFAASRFGPDGALVLSGVRGDGDAVGKWLEGAIAEQLATHPAVKFADGKPLVRVALKAGAWKLSPLHVQELLAASADPAVRRLRVDRVHLAHDGGSARLVLAGVRVGEDAIDADALPGALREHWPGLFAGPPRVLVDLTKLVGPGVPDPAEELRAAVASNPALDGVRIDPGAEFGPDGRLRLAGVQPGLTAAGEKALSATYQRVLKGLADTRGAAAPRYERLAAGAVSTKRMGVVATGKLLAELRAWAADTLDDVRVGRVYFAADGLLALDATAVSRDDAARVQAKFKELAAKHLPPEPDGAPFARLAPPAAAPTFEASLSALLRAEVAADPKLWSGVLIERGYFDAAGRFALRGVVDRAGQNAQLAKRLDALKADPKWAGYFAVAPAPPALEVVPLAALVERVKRVAPAYPAFDGVRIESARYDAAGTLVFDATTAVKLEPEPAALLTKLIRDHPTYRRRVPADRPVRIASVGTADEGGERFELAAGAKLLEGADRKAARAWLDAALLHHPTESGVWFLSAYDHHARGDAELTRRDLRRTLALEPPGWVGDALRRRRYDAVKALQGKERTELEALWAECVREFKDGVKPMTLAAEK